MSRLEAIEAVSHVNREKHFNVDNLRESARRRLPSAIFDFLEGGADDECTLGRNTTAFEEYEFVPHRLDNVGDVDTRTTLLNVDLDWPVILSPTGMSKLFHRQGELAVARAAAAAGTLYTLSAMGTESIESIASATNGPKMFQAYIFRDRGLTKELVERCRQSQYDALCLTMDTPIAGNRERDKASGMTMPPRFTWRSLASFISHPSWTIDALGRSKGMELANIAHRATSLRSSTISVMQYVNSQFDSSLTWKDVDWLRQLWDGPFVLKGVLSVDEAQNAASVGASAIMISNHGGRQLDGLPASIDRVGEIADAVGDKVEIIVDGGIRRGTHILKALALGARACSIGRPYLYGLAAGGERGVQLVLSHLRTELERNMILLGVPNLSVLSSKYVRRREARA